MRGFGACAAASKHAIILRPRSRAVFFGENSQNSDEAGQSQATLPTGRFSALIPCGASTPACTCKPLHHVARLLCRSNRQHIGVSVFLQPELVHAGKGIGLFRLQPMPKIEIAEETITAEEIAVVLHHSRRKFEPDEHQAVLVNEGFDLRNRQSVLLHVKQKVTALAGAEEIAGPGYILER